MNLLCSLFVIANGMLVFSLSRRWAHLPFLLGAIYSGAGQQLEIGSAHFTTLRLLVIIGVIRIYIKGERVAGGINMLDKLVVSWAVWLVLSSFFHNPISSVLVYRLGIAYEQVGVYWVLRVFIQNVDDFMLVGRTVLLLLVPIAMEMEVEKMTDANLFAQLGGNDYAEIRNGRIRAQGPFSHSILAGTVGAVCFPLAVVYWRSFRKVALVGFGATAAVVFLSASSGPILTLVSIVGAMATWKIRAKLRAIRWTIVVMLFALNFIMSAPVYYLIARIDFAGGSTGWYRAQLLKSAIERIDEWGLVGTDSTRNWMQANSLFTDITNYYLQMGIWGGIPLILLFIGILTSAFAMVGRFLRASEKVSDERQFLIWTLGCILFGHAVAFMSVSYFDQTFVFLLFALAGIGSLCAMLSHAEPATTDEATLAI